LKRLLEKDDASGIRPDLRDRVRAIPAQLINGQAGVSPDMAIRLAKAFGATPDIWIRMQAAYDLAQARLHENEIKVRPYRPAA